MCLLSVDPTEPKILLELRACVPEAPLAARQETTSGQWCAASDRALLAALGDRLHRPRPAALVDDRVAEADRRVLGVAPVLDPRQAADVHAPPVPVAILAVELDAAGYLSQRRQAQVALGLSLVPGALLVTGVGIGVFLLRKRQLLALRAATEGHRRALAAARRLAESERRFRMLADDAPLMIWSTDPTGCVDFVSRMWTQFVGRPPQSDLGTGWLECVHPDDRPRCASRLSEAIRRRRPFMCEYRVRRADGQWREILDRGVARFDDDGHFAGLIGGAIDVTELRRAERDLRRATRAAQAADRAKSEFLANMSHEIRTPLTTILGYADLLREDGDAHRAPPQRLQAIDLIRRAGRHLLTLLNDVLDLSKIEAGEMRVESVEVDLPRLLAECVDLMRFNALSRGVTLSLETASPLPVRVVTDPTRLRQVLLNLLGNAIKFTRDGTVTMRCAMKDSDLIVEVEDTGAGLSAEQATMLFQPFVQADPTVARTHGGTGLGLAISRRLATLLGGSVELVRSAPGEGSCFRATVRTEVPTGSPVLRDRAEFLSHMSRNDDLHPAEEVPVLEGRVLVAEDGRENRMLIVMHLERAGLQVTAAEDGRTALALVEEARQLGRPFDLLVTDLQMPEMDGLTLARALRLRGETLPIIALTAHDLGEDRERSLDAGCSDFASKPIERRTLLAVCARWLPQRATALPARAA